MGRVAVNRRGWRQAGFTTPAMHLVQGIALIAFLVFFVIAVFHALFTVASVSVGIAALLIWWAISMFAYQARHKVLGGGRQ